MVLLAALLLTTGASVAVMAMRVSSLATAETRTYLLRTMANGAELEVQAQQSRFAATANVLAAQVRELGAPLAALESARPYFVGLQGPCLLDADGATIAALPDGPHVGPAHQGIDYAHAPAVMHARTTNGVAVSGATAAVGSGPVLVFATLVPNSTMVLVAHVEPADVSLRDEVWDLASASGGGMLLVDGYQHVVYRSDGTILPLVGSNATLARLFGESDEIDFSYQPVWTPTPVLLAYTPVEGTPWGLALYRDPAAWLLPVAAYEALGTAVGALMVLATVHIVQYSVFRQLLPLVPLVTRSGQIIATHELPAALPLAGSPEVQEALRAVNTLTEAARVQEQALGRMVQEFVKRQEEERTWVALELHDTALQTLGALSLQMGVATRRLESGGDAGAAFADAAAIATAVQDDLRNLSNRLHPSMLTDLGLQAALGGLARDLEKDLPGLKTSLEVTGQLDTLPADVATALFRIAQEALANVRRHAAGATLVQVSLASTPTGVRLVIADNGRGAPDVAQAKLVEQGHFGIAGMTERAAICSGTLTVRTTPLQGFTLEVNLPVTP